MKAISSIHLRAAEVSGFLILATAMWGCADGTVSSASDSANLTISIRSEDSPFGKVTHNTLEITSAKVLLKNVRFWNSLSDDSMDVKAGPLAADISPATNLHEVIVSDIPAGSYDRLRFRVHKPEDQEAVPDPDFREGESGQLRYSVIVSGAYNGVPFTYKSGENDDQEVELPTPVEIRDDGRANVTLVVNAYLWFQGEDGYVNPSDAANEDRIDEAIRDSFASGFRDDDLDGNPDR